MNKKLLLTATLGALALTGCGQTAPETTANEAAETVTVVHTSGETEVTKNPENIVVMEMGILDALDVLEVEVAGIPLSGSLPDYLSHYADETKYTNVGSVKEIDLEKVYEVQPELIIIGGRQADYYEELSKIAPTIQLSVDSADYMASFETNMNYLGEIFEKEEVVAAQMAIIKEAVEEAKAVAAENQVTGLIALANDGSFSVYGAGSRFGLLHNELGVKPADETIEVSTHGQNASFEYIVEKNPDYLFVVDRAAVAGGETSAAQLFENDLIKTTKAYQNGNIVTLSANEWYLSNGGFHSTLTMVNEVKEALQK